MINLIPEKFQIYFEAYKQNFADNFPNEKYKWIALKQFQEHWNVDAPDFKVMLTEALLKTDNLLASSYNFPKGMLLDFCQTDAEAVRHMFRDLYDESVAVFERILNFKKQADTLLEFRMTAQGNTGKLQHYQGFSAISTYLWLKYPDKYFVYKYSEVKCAASNLTDGLLIKTGLHKDTVKNFFDLYNSIAVNMQNDGGFVKMLTDALDEDCYREDGMHTAVIDFSYFLNNYYPDLVAEKNEPEVVSTVVSTSHDRQYWWLVCNPKIWTMRELEVGQTIDYSMYSDSGAKRRVFQNFLDAKKGDSVIAYESTPTKQIIALAEVERENDGDTIVFKKTEALGHPVDYAVLKGMPALENMQYMQIPQGSLFKLTAEEYDALMEEIRGDNPIVKKNEGYTKEDFLKEVFVSEADYEHLKNLLEVKKNVILQGAPGVGKTFSAKRLAYAIMGEKDEDRIEMVQFHQNYCYEDFIMGYKPNAEGGFELKKGVFYNFCKRANYDRRRPYFFIIDEINRGNLSKIFGELMMLLEKDYRNASIKLAYSDELFTVPDNVFVIGMMNTADRSIAFLDYALRRRFSFFKMKPGFDTKGFADLFRDRANAHLDVLVNTVKRLNEEIANDASLGEGFQIGHSYFCKSGEVDDKWLYTLVEYDIIPMLEEYWFDNETKFEQWSEELRMAIK